MTAPADDPPRFRVRAGDVVRVVVVLLCIGLAIIALVAGRFDIALGESPLAIFVTDALVRIGPGLAGLVLAVITIDYLNERRQTIQLKAQLIRQLGSPYNAVADPASRELAQHGWLRDGTLRGADLRRASLSRVNLWGADLAEADLSGADLSETLLGNADLNHAHLERANLKGANLMGASLAGAHLAGANLNKAELWGIDLSHTDLTESNLSGVDLAVANLGRADLWRADLSGANLRDASMVAANLWEANLSGADLARANLSRSYLGTADFRNANLSLANLSDTMLMGADFRNADLTRANLRDAKHWRIDRLAAARSLVGATMPDGIQLLARETELQDAVDGPDFVAWRTDYLVRYGGLDSDVRDGEVQELPRDTIQDFRYEDLTGPLPSF